MKNNIIVPSSQFVDEKFKEYIFRLPFLYEHRDDIYSNVEYFYARLPFTVWHLEKHQVCIGAILKAFDKGEPFRTINKMNNTVEYIAAFAGNPMSGTTTGLKAIVNSNDTIHVERFRYTGFGGLMHRIAVCYEECQFPYRESPLTLHDVISQLDEQEHNGRSVCR